MIIAISGTPGTGKTYIANKIAKATKNRLEYFDLNKYVKDNKLYDSYDKKAKTYDVNIKELKKIIEPTFKKEYSKDKLLDKLIGKTIKLKELLQVISKLPKKNEGVIIDSHLSHYFKSDYCIIVKTDIKTLNKRLKARKYPKNKIQDNVESEIFEVCFDEARKLKKNIIIVEN
jgi:adenylate kinase